MKYDMKIRSIEKVLDEVGAPDASSIEERIRSLVGILSDQPIVDPEVKVLMTGWKES